MEKDVVPNFDSARARRQAEIPRAIDAGEAEPLAYITGRRILVSHLRHGCFDSGDRTARRTHWSGPNGIPLNPLRILYVGAAAALPPLLGEDLPEAQVGGVYFAAACCRWHHSRYHGRRWGSDTAIFDPGRTKGEFRLYCYNPPYITSKNWRPFPGDSRLGTDDSAGWWTDGSPHIAASSMRLAITAPGGRLA
jgi:hypothetical protein